MAKEGFLGSLGRFASQLVEGAPEGPRNVLYSIGPWLNELTRHAGARWLPHLVLGIPCEVAFRDPEHNALRQCAQPSIAACSICRKPTCLDHSFVNRQALAVCFACVSRGVETHAAPKVEWPPGTRGGARSAPSPGEAPPPPPPSAAAPDPSLAQRLLAARKLLGIKRARPSLETISAAYKQAALEWHPDRNHSPGARERFIAATAACELLKQHAEKAPS